MTPIERPMAGIRVLDIATFIAAPFCGTILAEFGAEVIKIEQPGLGDPLRAFGTPTEAGDSLVWLSEGRNKRSVTLDLRKQEGAEVFRRLVAQSDVVLENFRPGTLEKWGLGPVELHAINPRLIMLRISAYGQTGPYRDMPGFARIAHAFSGLSFLAGMPDGPPVVPGSTSLADYLSGMWGAIGVLMALRAIGDSGRGQIIDIGLYESIFRLLDELAPAYDKFGVVRERMGPDVPHVVPHGHWRTGDDQWIALACSSDRIFARFAELIGQPDLSAPDRFATSPQRIKGRAEINAAVTAWVGGLPAGEVLERCNTAGVPCGPVLSIADIFGNPQYHARGNLQMIDDPRVGPLTVPAPLPAMSGTPPRLDHLGRALGADTEDVLRDIAGIDPARFHELRREKVV